MKRELYKTTAKSSLNKKITLNRTGMTKSEIRKEKNTELKRKSSPSSRLAFARKLMKENNKK